MKKYYIDIEGFARKTLVIDAESEREAREKAESMSRFELYEGNWFPVGEIDEPIITDVYEG